MLEVLMDASQIEAFEACPRKWYYDYVMNLELKRSHSEALAKGSYWHEVLAFYYGQFLPDKTTPNYSITERMREAIKFGLQTTLLSKYRILKTGQIQFHTDRLLEYFNLHADEDEATQFIAVEKGFSSLLLEVPGRYRYILEGKIDIICRRPHWGLIIQDHKTQSRKDDLYEYNHQVCNYMRATGADYFEYDYIGLQDNLPPKGMRRLVFKPPEGVLKEWEEDVVNTFHEMNKYITAMNNCAHLVMPAEDREQFNAQFFPRRRHSCDSSKYGQCQFSILDQVPESDPLHYVTYNKFKKKDEAWRAWA